MKRFLTPWIRFKDIIRTVMPRVVPDQREKFENDELFRKMSRESEVRYTGYMDKTLHERQLYLRNDCREGHANIAFVNTGINLPLQFESNAWSSRREERVPTSEFVNFDREPGKVHLKSQFIMNGVCVMWRGWIDLVRLDGTARLEFDEHRATVEDEVLRQQIEQYNETVSRYHHHHHPHHHVQAEHQRDELMDVEVRRRNAAAPPSTDVVQALLDISALPSSGVHLQPPDSSHAGH